MPDVAGRDQGAVGSGLDAELSLQHVVGGPAQTAARSEDDDRFLERVGRRAVHDLATVADNAAGLDQFERVQRRAFPSFFDADRNARNDAAVG